MNMGSIKQGRDELMGIDLRYFRLGSRSWFKVEKTRTQKLNYIGKFKLYLIHININTGYLQNNLNGVLPGALWDYSEQ